MDGNFASNAQELPSTEAPPITTLPAESPVPCEEAVPPHDNRPARDTNYWSRRKAAVAEYAEEAFRESTALESNLAFLASDMMAHLFNLNEQLERALEQTGEPLDKLQMMRTFLPEVNKTSREARALTEILTRAACQRGPDKLTWTRTHHSRD